MAAYSETFLEHARYPHNVGKHDSANAWGSADLDGRPPVIEFSLRIDNEIIQAAHFEAAGCGVAIACGSALTDLVTGKSINEARSLDQQRLIKALEGIPPYKLYCAEVALAALRNALS